MKITLEKTPEQVELIKAMASKNRDVAYEAQAVLPGQTVPVLTRGTVLLTSGANGAIPGGAQVGANLQVAADGTLETHTDKLIVGKVIAEGYEVKKGAKGESVKKLLCQLSF